MRKIFAILIIIFSPQVFARGGGCGRHCGQTWPYAAFVIGLFIIGNAASDRYKEKNGELPTKEFSDYLPHVFVSIAAGVLAFIVSVSILEIQSMTNRYLFSIAATYWTYWRRVSGEWL